MITQEQVKTLFNYDPETGLLTRKINKNTAKKGDFCGSVVGKGYKVGRGYLATRINGKLYPNHRIAFIYVHGYLPEQIDHINNKHTDNRIVNLRGCTNSQNALNKPIRKDNKSGVKGVYWGSNIKKWRTEVTCHGVTENCGNYGDIEDARIAVEKARARLHKEFCNHG